MKVPFSSAGFRVKNGFPPGATETHTRQYCQRHHSRHQNGGFLKHVNVKVNRRVNVDVNLQVNRQVNVVVNVLVNSHVIAHVN